MIVVENLHKTFGTKKAVNNLSFNVAQGQVLGLIGPNGAGKSTTMRMVSGYLRPTAGTVHLCGINVWKNPVKAKAQLGYLPESAPLFEELTVHEFLNYLGSIRGLSGKGLEKACDRVIDQCFLGQVRHQLIDTLSKGYRHRTCLAQSLLHDPPVIIFDEPTDGLDPNQKEEIRNLVNGFREDKAIILSTHILEEVNAVCTDVLLIDNGTKLFHGTPKELRSHSASYGNVSIHARPGSAERLKETVMQSAAMNMASHVEPTPSGLYIQPRERTRESAERLAAALLHAAHENNVEICGITHDEGSLEDVFRSLTIQSKSTDTDNT